MCLVILAPKGVSKNSNKLYDAIRTAAVTNDDGMGFAYKKAGKNEIYLNKGYQEENDLDKFFKDLEKAKLSEEDELIIHLRIGNKGAINVDMCHPFVISQDKDEILEKDKIVKLPVFVHNGTLYKYSLANSDFSDTYYFAKDFLSNPHVINFLKEDPTTFKSFLKEHLGVSRFAFLFPDKDVDAITLGDFVEDEGYFFSNKSYTNSLFRNVGGVNHYRPQENKTRGGYSEIEQDSYNDYWSNIDKCRNKQFGKETEPFETGNRKEIIDDTITKSRNLLQRTKSGFHIDDIVIKSDEPSIAFDHVLSGTKYRKYMGLYIPDTYKYNQREEIFVELSNFTFDKISFRCLRGNTSIGTDAYMYYDMLSYDEDGDFHVMQATNRYGKKDNIYLGSDDILRDFETRASLRYKGFFDKYITLVAKLNNSKKDIKRVSKTLKKNIHKESVSYKLSSLGPIDRSILELYLYNLCREHHSPTEANYRFNELIY